MAIRQVYLDHNATTPIHPEVKKALAIAADVFGNPSSLHSYGRAAKSMIEDARAQIAGFINADPQEIIFTGSGSEANNSVLSIFSCCSVGHDCIRHSRREVLTSTIEHPCVLESSRCLVERGTKVSNLKVDKAGKLDLDSLKSAITDATGMVSVMTANNEIGTIQDIKTISCIVHEKGALFHTDAVQAVGKIPIDVKDLDVDFLTFSAHKIYGPKGVGAIYVRKGVPFCPFIHGGHQERGRRAGTENTLGIVGMAKAIAMRKAEMVAEEIRLKAFKQMLKEGIEKNIPDICINGHQTDCLAGTLNVSFEGTEGEAVLLYLDMQGIAVSTGSACASGSLDPSHVLLAIGLGAEFAHSSIRMSLGRDTTKADIEYVVTNLTEVVAKVRSISTAYNKK
jgi:cysteine desulfurase